MTEKPVRLTGDQINRLVTLTRRQLQIAEIKLRRLGVSQAEIDAALARADRETIPIADGGTIAIEGDQYNLVDADDTAVTLRKA